MTHLTAGPFICHNLAGVKHKNYESPRIIMETNA